MIDGGLEEDGRRGVRVVVWEGHGELEGEIGVGGVLRPLDSGFPSHKVTVCAGKGRDARGRRCHELHELGLESVVGGGRDRVSIHRTRNNSRS